MTLQQSPFLRSQRNFPIDSMQSLCVEIDKMYIDVAQRVNDRTLGIFTVNNPTAAGESWYLTGSSNRQQTLRQLYVVSGTGNIAHGINTSNITGFTRIYGTFTDGSNFYTLPYVDTSNVNNQISIYVTPTNIVITAGAGAPPAIVSGWVVLEWLAFA